MEQLMNFNDVKEYLNVSRATMYRLIHDKRVPFFKVGIRWRFRKEKVDKWIKKKKIASKWMEGII